MKLAPVVMFTYNRPGHTEKTLSSLLDNKLSGETEITIYSDAPRTKQEIEGVSQVRRYLKSISGFKSINIIEQNENQGLAKSIINGVTHSVKEHGRTIVLEDDMLTSPYFLTYMNEALDLYKTEKRVMHITGWSYPISQTGLDDSFLWRGMNCWGWATWADRWMYFQKDAEEVFARIPAFKRRHFDLNGRRKYWSEVVFNRSGHWDTWAVFWYATIYLRSGLCVNPTESMVKNIGLDGTGIHCRPGTDTMAGVLGQKRSFKFQQIIAENELAFKRIIHFYDEQRGPLTLRVLNKLRRMLKI
jgi:hypothetical protein